MKTVTVALVLFGLAFHVMGAPSPKADDGEVPERQPLLTFKDGNVGVNFLGFKASAGLGGLLNGDATQGGLHAEAETPFGQKAGAGLGGRVDGNGRSIGGLYAGATAGGGVGAMAGLDGVADADGSAGRSYAGASAGGVGKTVIKESFGPPPVAGASLSGSVNIQKVASPPSQVEVEVVKEKRAPLPKSRVDIEIVKDVPAHPVKTTYVERKVIPNYVEKTIQVPSYVEKTIRVPTVVEKTIKVPAPPTIIEKEVEVPVKTVTKTKQVTVQEEEFPVVPTTIVKTRTKFHRRPWLQFRKRIQVNAAETPYYGGVVAGSAGADAASNSVADSNAGFGGFGTFGYTKYYAPLPPPPPPATYTATVRKQYNGNLVKDIFNIPIATLGAVSNLVGNIAGGAAGSVSVSKTYGSTYRK